MKQTKKTVILAIFLLAGGLIVNLFFPSVVLADCDINDCLSPEHGQQGSCQEGAVLECDTGRKKCVGTSWVDTEEDLNDLCTVTYVLFGSPFEKHQKALEACEAGEWNLECQISGTEPINPEGFSGILPSLVNGIGLMIVGPSPSTSPSQSQTYRPGGAIGGLTNLIAMMYAKPPASSVEYLADIGNRLNLVKPAYAQGIGFKGMKPILELWKAFRNLAYVFFTIVFVAIGFAIMFRVKLNPQTVIGIQSALPRIVLALILVTFSYAIAGLMIDVIYVISSLGVSIINPQPQGVLENIIEFFNNLPFGIKLGGGRENPNITVFSVLFLGRGMEFALALSRVFNPVTLVAELLNAPEAVVKAIQGVTSFNVGLASSFIALILLVILLFAFFKLFISLLMAYVRIIISLIFAPLQLMLGAIPGSNSFGVWFRNLLANIAVFPTVIIMMALTSRIVASTEGRGALWMPPLIRLPKIGSLVAGHAIAAMIGYGLLLLTPKVADMVRDALKVKPFAYGTAIGEAFGPVRAGVGYGKKVAFIAGPEFYFQRRVAAGKLGQPGSAKRQLAEAFKKAIQAIGGG